MDYDYLPLHLIPEILPQFHTLKRTESFINAFTRLLPQNMAARVACFLDDIFFDVLLDSLKDDEVFVNIASSAIGDHEKLLLNYFILNYSPYLH